MKLFELGVLYLLVGVGCVVALYLRRDDCDARLVDGLLVFAFWPLYGPFLLARYRGNEAGPGGSEVAFLAALRRARSTPLAACLPDQETVRALGRRLRVAAGKVDEIDDLLTRPEFDQEDAEQRLEALCRRQASDYARSTATMRLQNIQRLRGLRDRFARELDEVNELLTQLKTQVEVVRLAGAPDSETAGLVQDLVLRVEGLDCVLADEPAFAPLRPDEFVSSL